MYHNFRWAFISGYNLYIALNTYSQIEGVVSYRNYKLRLYLFVESRLVIKLSYTKQTRCYSSGFKIKATSSLEIMHKIHKRITHVNFYLEPSNHHIDAQRRWYYLQLTTIKSPNQNQKQPPNLQQCRLCCCKLVYHTPCIHSIII